MAPQNADIYAIFNEAVERESDDDRARYLDEACRGDAKLREEVESLLCAHSGAGKFLGGASPQIAPTIDTGPATEQIGAMIGRYKLVYEMGQGGMGMVYMAVQKEPVKRKVALKVIKPGMDTREVVARFEAERQALALMDHPHIATVLDGGTTQSGRPYFVMELVVGAPINEYCDECKFTTQQRLELFTQVCQAVQHAHQKGVIHRDIKPSNILVTNDDDQAVPKVIDFGIAKALYQPLTDQSLYTHATQMIGTPLYMSPEQAQRSGRDVDTRTDVYSLGALLYELLSGTLPFDKDRLQTSGVEEFKRIIREEEPPRPSTRLSTVDAALETMADKHGTDIGTLTRELSGELDWIVMKALEKDRNRRYETAADFARDVQRYLNDEAVMACPPTTTYRLTKFARRNKAAITFAFVLFVSLLVGIGGTTWMAFEAKEEQKLAEIAAANEEKQRKEAEWQRERAERQEKIARENFERARNAVDEYLTRVSEEELLDTPGLQPLREDLLELALKYYEEFAAERASDSALQVELAEAYLRIGAIKKQIGSQEEMLGAIQKAIAICGKLVDSNPGEARFLDLLARGHDRLGRTLVLTYDEKQLSCRKAIEIWEALEAEDPDNLAYQQSLANSWHRLGSILLSYPRKQNEALDIYQKAIEIQKRLVESDPDLAEYRDDLARTYINLGILQSRMRKSDEALFSWQEARKIWEKLLDDEPSVPMYRKGLALALGNLSNLDRKSRRWDKAIASERASLDIFRELADENPRVFVYQEDLARAYGSLGSLKMSTGDQDAALHSHGEALIIRKKLVDACPDVVKYRVGLAKCYHNCAVVQLQVGKLIEAKASFEKAIELEEDLASQSPPVPGAHVMLAMDYMSLGNLQRNAGSVEEALASYQKAIDIWQKLVDKNPDLSVFRMNLVRSLLLLGKLQTDNRSEEAAAASYEKVVVVLSQVPEGKRGPVDWGNLGLALFRLDRWQDAREALESGIQLRNEKEPTIAGGPRWWYLTMALAQLGEQDKAQTYYKQLVPELEAQEKPAEMHTQLRAEAAELLGITDPKEDKPQDEEETNSKTRDEAEIKRYDELNKSGR